MKRALIETIAQRLARQIAEAAVAHAKQVSYDMRWRNQGFGFSRCYDEQAMQAIDEMYEREAQRVLQARAFNKGVKE